MKVRKNKLITKIICTIFLMHLFNLVNVYPVIAEYENDSTPGGDYMESIESSNYGCGDCGKVENNKLESNLDSSENIDESNEGNWGGSDRDLSSEFEGENSEGLDDVGDEYDNEENSGITDEDNDDTDNDIDNVEENITEEVDNNGSEDENVDNSENGNINDDGSEEEKVDEETNESNTEYQLNTEENTNILPKELEIELLIPEINPQTNSIVKKGLEIKEDSIINIDLCYDRAVLSNQVSGGDNIIVEVYSGKGLVGQIVRGEVVYAVEFIPNNVNVQITGMPGSYFDIQFTFEDIGNSPQVNDIYNTVVESGNNQCNEDRVDTGGTVDEGEIDNEYINDDIVGGAIGSEDMNEEYSDEIDNSTGETEVIDDGHNSNEIDNSTGEIEVNMLDNSTDYNREDSVDHIESDVGQ